MKSRDFVGHRWWRRRRRPTLADGRPWNTRGECARRVVKWVLILSPSSPRPRRPSPPRRAVDGYWFPTRPRPTNPLAAEAVPGERPSRRAAAVPRSPSFRAACHSQSVVHTVSNRVVIFLIPRILLHCTRIPVCTATHRNRISNRLNIYIISLPTFRDFCSFFFLHTWTYSTCMIQLTTYNNIYCL